MKIKKIIFGTCAILILFLGYIAFSPSDFQVKRSVKIYVPKNFFLPNISDREKLSQWIGSKAELQILDSTDTSVEAVEAFGENKIIHKITLEPFFVTVIQWEKSGQMSYLQKLKSFFSNRDKVIGTVMEQRLALLRDQTQAEFKK
jgi:hypothetical protein